MTGVPVTGTVPPVIAIACKQAPIMSSTSMVAKDAPSIADAGSGRRPQSLIGRFNVACAVEGDKPHHRTVRPSIHLMGLV